MNTEASHLNTPEASNGYTLDKTESLCEFYDVLEGRWREMDEQADLDLRSREANQLLARPWEENASTYAEVREYMRLQAEAHD